MTAKNKLPLANELLRRIEKSSYGYPLLILDTSAVIELENDDPRNAPAYLHDIGEKYRLILPEMVVQELTRHNAECVMSNRKEVGDKTMGIIKDHALKNQHLIARAYSEENPHDIGLIRLDVTLAMFNAFEENHKKGYRDPISRADKQVVELSYLLSAEQAGRNENQSPIRIISTDEHILGSIQFLNPFYPNFDVQGIHGGRK